MRLFFLSLFSLQSFAADLTILLESNPEDTGLGMIALYNSKDNYDEEDNPFRSLECSLESFQEKTCILKDLPLGEYSVAFFWDENNNKELDTNFIGYPKEPFGFSQNPTIIAGKPSFKSTKFSLAQENLNIKIELK